MVIINTVVYVRAERGGSASDLALALAASGAGSILVALLLPRLLDRVADRPVMLCGAALLLAGLLLGLLNPGLVWLLPVWFVLGCGMSLVQTPVGRVLRRSCRDSDRPAFFAAQFALSHLCWLFAYPLAGTLGSAGTGAAFAGLVLVVAISAVAAARLWPHEDAADLAHVHDAVAHEHLHTHDEHHQHGHAGWEGPEPHSHAHRHAPLRHRHAYVIDLHHSQWPA
jgi:MFS family permease